MHEAHRHEVEEDLTLDFFQKNNPGVSLHDLTGGGFEIVLPEEGIGQRDGQFVDMGRSLEIAKVDQAGKA